MENVEPSVENPLIILQKLAEDIPSGVSAEDLAKIVPVLRKPDEIVDDVNKKSSMEIKQQLVSFWKNYGIEEKLSKLHDFQMAPSVNHCSNLCKIHQMKLGNQRLKEKIAQKERENADLEEKLKDISKLYQGQLHDVKELYSE